MRFIKLMSSFEGTVHFDGVVKRGSMWKPKSNSFVERCWSFSLWLEVNVSSFHGE